MKLRIFGVLIILVVLINSATAGNVAPASAVIYDTNGDNKTKCGDTLKLSFHTSSPWTIKLNGVLFMNGSGPDNKSMETIPLENTFREFIINSTQFKCNGDDQLTINSSIPSTGQSTLILKFPLTNKSSYILNDWFHLDPPEPPVPEMSTVILMSFGIIALFGLILRKKD